MSLTKNESIIRQARVAELQAVSADLSEVATSGWRYTQVRLARQGKNAYEKLKFYLWEFAGCIIQGGK
jgi:hypothetical protein